MPNGEKPSTYVKCHDFELCPFSRNETANFLQTRLKNVSQTEINVAHARSGGNPRVLDYLLKSGHGLLDESEIDRKVELDELIKNRIVSALSTAIERDMNRITLIPSWQDSPFCHRLSQLMSTRMLSILKAAQSRALPRI